MALTLYLALSIVFPFIICNIYVIVMFKSLLLCLFFFVCCHLRFRICISDYGYFPVYLCICIKLVSVKK